MREDVLYHRLLRVGSLSALGAFSRTVYGGTLKKEEKKKGLEIVLLSHNIKKKW